MVASLWPHYVPLLDSNGDVISGGTLAFFEDGTTTPKAVFSNEGLSAALGTTVTTDANGYPASGGAAVSIWAADDAKVVVKNAAGTTLRTIDPLLGDTIENALAAGAAISFTGVNSHSGKETFTGDIEADDSDIDLTITDPTVTTEGAHLGIHKKKTFVYRVEGIDENTTKQWFKFTLSDIANIHGTLTVDAMLDGVIPAGFSRGHYRLSQTTDGGGPLIGMTTINSFGKLALAVPVVSGSAVIFGGNIANNGTSVTSNAVDIYITLTYDTAGSFTFAGLNGATDHTGAALASAVTFGADLKPIVDDTYDLGDASHRMDDLYATNGTVQTSDVRTKEQFSDPETALLDAVGRVPFKAYKLKTAVSAKGAKARTHFGIIADDLEKELRAEGIDPGDLSLFVKPKDEDGNVVADGLTGYRPVEFMQLEMDRIRREIAALKSEVSALKK